MQSPGQHCAALSGAMERVNRSKPTLCANFFLFSKQRHSAHVEFTEVSPCARHSLSQITRRWLAAGVPFLFNALCMSLLSSANENAYEVSLK